MKICGATKVILYKDDKIVMKDVFANIIGYLYNRHLIDLPDEYWAEDDNGWKVHYYKKYRKIFNDFERLVKDNYKIERVEKNERRN